MNNKPVEVYSQLRPREVRRTSLLALMSIIMIGGLLIFEFAAVILLHDRLLKTWHPEREQQVLVRQVDDVRARMRKIDYSSENERKESSYVLNEINLFAGYYKLVRYDVTREETAAFQTQLNALGYLFDRYWASKNMLITQEKPDYTLLHKRLRAALDTPQDSTSNRGSQP